MAIIPSAARTVLEAAISETATYFIGTRETRGIDRFCDYPCVYCIVLSYARRRNQMVNENTA